MQKANKHPTNDDSEVLTENSENVQKNIKFINKLEMQRSILNKLVDINLNQPVCNQDLDQGKSETNELLTNKQTTMKKQLHFTVFLCVLIAFIFSTKNTHAQTWEPTNGPFGGIVSSYTNNESYLFVGVGAAGIFGKGIFRSSDNGASWVKANQGLLPSGSGLGINALIKSEANIVASTGNGIYYSTNNGDSWIPANYPGQYYPNCFYDDGTNLFCGGIDGLFISTDNGLNWTAHNDNFQGLTPPNVPDIKSMAVSGNNFYIGTSVKGIFRSTDGGNNWLTVNSGLGTPSQIISRNFYRLAIVGTDIFAGTLGQGVFRLLNNGTSWTNEITGLPTGQARFIFSFLVKDDKIYCGGNQGLFVSNNTGTISWTASNGNLGIQQYSNLFNYNSNIYASISSRGIYISNDNTANWTASNNGMTGLSTQYLTQGLNDEILASTYEGYIYNTANEGASWSTGNINAEAGPCVHGTSMFVGGGGNCYRSTDNGTSWVELPGFIDVGGPAYTFYSKGDTLFAGCVAQFGVYFTTDNGETWNQTSGIWNLDPNGGYPNLLSITSVGSTMFAGTVNGVFKSIDNGLNWTSCYPSVANQPISSVVICNNNIYAATANYFSDQNLTPFGIYRSTDNGASWSLVNNGLSNHNVFSLAVSGTNIYAGTTTGIYTSNNDGNTWTTMNEGYITPPFAKTLFVQGNYMYSGNYLVGQEVYRRALTGSSPDQPSAIEGPITPCIGSSQNYSVTNVPGVTYTWQFLAGGIITGGGTTNSVTVTVGSTPGVVLVTPSNGWGNGPAQFLVVTPTTNAPAQPGTITGLTNPDVASIQTYSVVNDPGVTYAWSFPSGWVQTGGGTANSVTVTVGSGTGNIQVTPSTPCGTGTARTLAVTPVAGSKTLNLTSVLLEGLYNGAGTMLQANDGNGAHWPAGVADHITVELHDAANYATIVYTVDVALSTTGTASVTIPADKSGSYYITIKHRNSIATVSSSPVSFAGSTITYAFNAPAQAYGGNLLLMIDGTYVIYGGDVNQDGGIDTSDMEPVDNDSANYASGYIVSDVNGDGGVDTEDMGIIGNNASNYVGAVTP